MRRNFSRVFMALKENLNYPPFSRTRMNCEREDKNATVKWNARSTVLISDKVIYALYILYVFTARCKLPDKVFAPSWMLSNYDQQRTSLIRINNESKSFFPAKQTRCALFSFQDATAASVSVTLIFWMHHHVPYAISSVI